MNIQSQEFPDASSMYDKKISGKEGCVRTMSEHIQTFGEETKFRKQNVKRDASSATSGGTSEDEVRTNADFSRKNGDPESKQILKDYIAKEDANMEKIDEYTKKITESIRNGDHTIFANELGVLSHLGEYIEEPFSIIESYFRGQHLERLARHQIESYNHFINFQVLRTIQMFNPVNIRSENDYVEENGKYTLEIFVSFENFKLLPPQIYENNGATKLMLPQEAKLRNFTYASTMYIDLNIQYIIRNTEKMDSPKIINTILPKINIGKMPIMIKSSICVLTQNSHISHKFTGECPMDCGGYFIIKGSEKTVLGQERAAENRVYCFDGKNTTKWDWFVEIKSVPDFKCISPKQIEMMIASKNNGFGNAIYVSIPRIKQPIELFVLFRALGITVDKQICEYIVLDIDGEKYTEVLRFLEASIIDANKYTTQEDALRHITASVAYTPINMDKETGGRKKREFAMDVLNNDLFPHCKTLTQKLYLLGYMANKLIQTSFGWRKPDDRDSYLNKRIDLTGTLLNNLFRNYFNKLVKEMQKQVIREINNGSWRSTEDYENIINMTNIYKIIKSTTIENGITRALATGDFSIKQANSTKVGVAQVLTRLTYMSCLSHIRRINTPLEKSGELIAPRKLHNTSFGFLCCFTGDTEILLANQTDTIYIRDLANSDLVTTINPANLLAEPSPIHSWFRKMPDKLYKLTLNNGITIKATPDHKFLTVQRNGKYVWKELKDLCSIKDRVVVRHTVRHIPFVASEQRPYNICINDDDDLEIGDHILRYITELKKLGYIGRNIPAYKLRILARLIGALNANGILYQLGFTSLHQCQPNDTEYKAIFRVFCESDCEAIDAYAVKQILADIAELGFTLDQDNTSLTPAMSRNDFEYMSNTHEIHIYGAFAYLLYKLGAILGKDKVNVCPYNPDWIVNGEQAIKREYLSGIQGQLAPQVYYDSYTDKVAIGAFVIKTRNTMDFLKNSRTYLNQIKQMFADLGIKSRLYQNNIPSMGGAEGLKNKFTNLSLRFKQSAKNIITYVDTIYHAYNDTLRIQCASAIELIKTRYYHRYKCGNDMYNVLSNSQKMAWSYHESIDIEYVNENCLENGCIASPIYSMACIEPEYVYDFTTQSPNHSFVASSFVAHNCSETPEGGSIGVVKNISYMAHITIPTNSASLYEYVEPYIVKLEDVPAKELYEKIKVFINGAWVGIALDPMTLYTEMKHKKYKGIINIYTSIVFDFKMGEIRICSDGGRLTRPLLKVRDGKAIITRDVIQRLEKGELDWNDLLTNCKLDESVIEYIDPEEQNYAMIAMKTKNSYLQDIHVKINYTHCEIHPSTIFGVLASCAPYPDHNQAPRVTYQCLAPEEHVWMADGTKKEIKDVRIGDKVLTFHPETLDISVTPVVNQFVRPNEYPIYKITTISGKSIKATEDHKFMTNKGWKMVKEMIEDPSIKIGMFMTNYNIIPQKIDNSKCILSEEMFIAKMRDLKINETKNRKINKIFSYVNQLKEIGLLPLFEDNPILPILCRIIGFLYADGSINIYIKHPKNYDDYKSFQCAFDFGCLNDALQFENDIETLGFNKSKILEGTRQFTPKTKNIVQTHHTFTCIHNGCLPAFLISLGISYGKKTETPRTPILDWIINNKEYGRQFIKGFQGGDGCKIRWNSLGKKGYNFICAETSQQINPIYKDSLIVFMNQCIQIIQKMNIDVSDVITHETKDDTPRIIIAYKIRDKHENLIKYFDTIGYVYCEKKNNESFKIVEYLKAKNIFSENYQNKINKIRSIYKLLLQKNLIIDGEYSTLIKTELEKENINVNKNLIRDTIRALKKGCIVSCPKLKDFNIINWLNETIEEKNNCLFVPIDSITPEPDGLISCIETESENHSFLSTNAFAVQNCAMVKQAIGIYATNFDQRMDKSAYILNYPSRPLVDTRLMNFINLNRIPSGCQVHVAIASFTGYNQEDSILINSGSIDRGLFSATIYHTEKDEDKNIIRDEIIRCKPDPTKTKCIKFGKSNKFDNYSKLNSQGFIPENSLVENRDIIIAKIIPIKENRNDPTKTIKYEDQSKSFRTNEETYVDKNYTGRNGDGYNFAKVRVRTFRKPVIGDKFACFKKNCEILSSEGWIPIEKVTLQHKVCILDPETDNIHYEYPSEIHCYDYDSETHGKLYQMKSSLVELTVTYNHRMWVKKRAVLENNKYDYRPNYEFIEAKDCFGKRLKYKKSASNFQPDNWIGDTFIIPSFTDGNKLIRPEIKVDTNDWLVFFGIWLAEGYSDKNKVGIAAHKPRVKAALEPVIQRMGFNVCKSKIKTSEIANNWVINNVQLCNLMKTYSVGAIHKYLPEWVWRLNKEQSRLLITSMMLGDGHITNANTHIYYTSSEKLADDLSRLCLHAGWSSHKRKINSKMAGTTTTIKGTNKTITSTVDHIGVTIIKTKLEPEMNHGHKKTQNGQSEEWIDYKGTVHCLTVRTGIFMVRQNGKPVWSGNSRSAQKGTVGNIIPECDMPFTKDGLRPDIILNPHAIPSRMTIGQLKETLLGKVLLELGLFGDGTSFGDLNVHTIAEELQKLGYESYGNEILYNGATGEQIETSIFFGPVFYQRLKHMVNDKQHSRSIGPMVNLTHQPAEGRSRDGGFRIGEMERDVLCAHGMTKFTRERLYDVSDKYTTNICKKCGMIACFNDGDKNRTYANNDFSIHLCRTCGNKTDFALVEMPYANKLLFQELQTINVAPRVITE